MKESMFFILTKASKIPAMVLGSIPALFILATAGHSTRANETTLPLAGHGNSASMPGMSGSRKSGLTGHSTTPSNSPALPTRTARALGVGRMGVS